MLGHVLRYVLLGPMQDGVELEQLLVRLDWAEPLTKGGLMASHPREPSPRGQLAKCSVHGLHLIELVVSLQLLLIALP